MNLGPKLKLNLALTESGTLLTCDCATFQMNHIDIHSCLIDFKLTILVDSMTHNKLLKYSFRLWKLYPRKPDLQFSVVLPHPPVSCSIVVLTTLSWVHTVLNRGRKGGRLLNATSCQKANSGSSVNKILYIQASKILYI